MGWILGMAIFVAGASMTVIARPRQGVPIRFVDGDNLGWLYALTATFGLVIGVALIVADWPV